LLTKMSEAKTINNECMKKACTIFQHFLVKLERILKKSALINNTEISVLYVQKPLKLSKGFYTRGVVKIGNSEFPFEVAWSLESETITLDSPVFLLRFRLPLKEFEEILD